MRLGIVEYIDSAHFIPGHDTCEKMHGHTYKIEIKIEGSKDKSGMIVDFYEIKKIVREVLEEYDHCSLNDLMDNPTCENVCESIYSKLKERLVFPLTLKIWEGQDKWVEI